jgi:creatinine amidohydrolase
MADAPTLLRWETLTKKQFDQIDPARAVVMVTSSPMEVHGPHLPLGADALEGEGLAERVLRFLPDEHRERTFLKLPFVYAATDVVPQRGSLHFRPSTNVRLLTDLGHTLAMQGFHHIIVSNFHGGPRHFLSIEKACTRVNRRHGIAMVSLFSLLIGRLTNGTAELGDVLGSLPGVNRADLDGDTHGGLVETSQLLALHGGWVDPEHKNLPRQTVGTWLESNGEAPRESAGGGPRSFLHVLNRYKGAMRFFNEETYSGAPAGASAEIGERILDTLAGKAAEACAELLDGKIGPADCHSPIWKYRFLFLNPLMMRLSEWAIGHRNSIA